MVNQNNKNRATISVTNNVEIMEALEVVVVVDSVVVVPDVEQPVVPFVYPVLQAEHPLTS